MAKTKRRKLPILPPMRCDDGCGACCGPAPITSAELEELRDYVLRNNIPIQDQGITCPAYLNGRCAVYEVRPMVCRLFGHVEGLACERGYNTNIPEEQVGRFLNGRGEATHVTHELLLLKNRLLTRNGILQNALERLPSDTPGLSKAVRYLRGTE
jgi:Fe-S-cluster containining protein